MKFDPISIILLFSLALSILAFQMGAIVLFTIGLEVFSGVTFGILTYQNRKHHSRYLICETVLLLIIASIIDALFFDAFVFEKNDFIIGLIILLRFLYNVFHYNLYCLKKYLKTKYGKSKTIN